jgi:hypothetical protein
MGKLVMENLKRAIYYPTDKCIDVKPIYLESGEVYCIEISYKEKESNPTKKEVF